jgi:integrase
MTTAAPSAAPATNQPVFTDAERIALAGFLAGYRGVTRDAYALDLRQFTTWCRGRFLALFAVRRVGIEGFARDLEARGRARTTVSRRLSTIAGSCKYAVEEEVPGTSPAAHVRRPRVDYESHAVALDRSELGALLVAAGLGPPPGAAQCVGRRLWLCASGAPQRGCFEDEARAPKDRGAGPDMHLHAMN